MMRALRHPVDRLAFAHVESHGGLEVRIVGCNPPSGKIQRCQGLTRVGMRVQKRGDQGDRLHPQAWLLDTETPFPEPQALGELVTLVLRHPGWTLDGLDPLNDVVLLAECGHPA